jgi:polyhydroxyalkanoate synthesis regulator protein
MTDTTVALPLIIKRYARSRLYEPGRGRYVSIDTLRAWKAKAIAFIVVDTETGEDVTRVLLA